MGWVNEWATLATEVKAKAEQQACPKCGTTKTVGYGSMGMPYATCPKCNPKAVRRTVDQAWGDR